MAVAAAETKEYLSLTPEIRTGEEFASTLEDIQSLPEVDTNIPQAVSVAELPGDKELVAQAHRNLQARIVGDIAVAETVTTPVKPIKNIREGIIWGSEGDREGEDMSKANIRKDANERVFKAGNVTTSYLNVDADGNMFQYGQNTDHIHRNAYQMASEHPIIKDRTVAEANNNARIKNEYLKGSLKDNVFVVFSLCAEGLSDKELDKLNFFSLTKSMSIQATTEAGGRLQMESAFVAGVADENSERHDRQVVEEFGARRGINYKGKTTAEIINMGMLIPKKDMPNGVVDLVKEADEINGGTFFGQNKSAQDYVEFKEFCEQREAGFEGDVDKVYHQLVKEIDSLPTAVDVSKRLGKLVEKHMVERAIEDNSIDERIFGETSAAYIESARELYADGRYAEAIQHMHLAQQTAKSGSCASSLSSLALLSPAQLQSYLMAGGTEAVVSSGKDQFGSLTFTCQSGHANTRPYGKLISNCTTCDRSVKC